MRAGSMAVCVTTHRIHCASHDTTQWIPGVLIEPIPEIVETLFRKELCNSVVEVWIKLVDDTLILDDGEKADAEGLHADEYQR